MHFPRLRNARLVVALLLVPALLASAGTRADPEVTDAAGDTRDSTGFAVSAPASDVVAAWFVEKSASEFEVHVRVSDLAPPATGVSQLWRVRWESGGVGWAADAERFSDGERANLGSSVVASGYPTTDDGSAVLLFDDALDVITLAFPRTFDLAPPSGAVTRVDFGVGTTFAAPRAEGWRGTGFVASPTVNDQVDGTAAGRDFVFGRDTREDPVAFSGLKPFDPIATERVVLDGVVTTKAAGSGSFATLSFTATNNAHAFTFRDVVYPLAARDVVTLTGFSGDFRVAQGSLKFSGTAASATVSR